MMEPVAITGMGSWNALGRGVDAFEAGLREGSVGIGPLTVFPGGGLRCGVAAELVDGDLPGEVPRAIARRASRSTRLALGAAIEAWSASGAAAIDPVRVGIIVGTTTGGMSRGEEACRRVLAEPPERADVSLWCETPTSTPADAIAAATGAAGPRLTVSTACSSGAHAMGIAAQWLDSGRADAVLCGGVDALCRITFAGFDALRSLAPGACRPFDRDREGLTLGEGAGFFVLEQRETASGRRAEVLGELAGYGASADAHHPTQPDPDGRGAVAAMREALRSAGVAPEAIDYVNAHGTGTPMNDVIEARAIRSIFGARTASLPVSSTKSMIGHCLGGAGAVEALATMIGIRGRFAPPTATLENPDPECDLDHVTGRARDVRIVTALSNSYGFGGNNACLVLRAAS